MSRPSKLNEELIKKAGELVLEGTPILYVCDSLMITQPCHSLWMKQGKEDFENEIESLYAEYFITIKKNQADYVINAGRDIRSGRQGWQGQSWWLERTRQEFMPKQEIVADEGRVQVVLGGKVKEVKQNGTKALDNC